MERREELQGKFITTTTTTTIRRLFVFQSSARVRGRVLLTSRDIFTVRGICTLQRRKSSVSTDEGAAAELQMLIVITWPPMNR